MHDVIVIGGGPAGSTASTLLAREGFRVVLFERERFPRFQIGESMLPYSNDIFRRLGVDEKLVENGEFFPKYGAGVRHRRRLGELPCSVSTRRSSRRTSRSFQVERAEFDQLLLDHSRENGVDVREETAVARVDLSDRAAPSSRRRRASGTRRASSSTASGHGAVLGASRSAQSRSTSSR